MDLGLNNKIALITAASQGLGKASALSIANEGAKVIICSRDKEKISKSAKEIKDKSGSEVISFQADLSNEGDISKMVESIIKKYGRIDILVNNTGGGNQCVIELQTSTSTPSGNVTLSPGSNITITNPAANFYTISAAASTSWTQQADFGSNNTINNGDTLDIAGGVYIKTTSNATSGKEVEIDHSLTTRSDTTSTASPGSGGTFTVVDSVTSNNTGHVTAVNVKTVTMPTVTPGGGGLNPTVKTTSYTASADDFIICNVNGTLDITLPAAGSSSVGDIIGVKYASQNAQTDKLRVFTNASGDKIDGTDRSSSPLPIPSVNTYYEFIYGSANNWYIK